MRQSQIIIAILVLIMLSLGGWYLLSQRSQLSQSNPTPSPVTSTIPPSGPITLQGQLVCLPHRNTDGPQTMECAYGLKDTSGRYFALRDSDPTYHNISGIATNSEVEVQGDFTPQSDTTYQSVGIIAVSKITSLSPTSPDTSQLPTIYITSQDWPPSVNVENKPFNCTEAGSETDRAGQTKRVQINNHSYCVTKVTEGAAGSVYTQYAYARAKNNQTEIYTFSLRFVQCGNYAEPEKTTCEKERQTFNIDNFIDAYIQSNS